MWWRAGETSNSIGNLLLHLEGSTRMWIVDVAGGSKSPRNRQQEFEERRHIAKAELIGRIRRMLAEADDVPSRLDPGTLLEMHTGQVILLAKTRAGADLHLSD